MSCLNRLWQGSRLFIKLVPAGRPHARTGCRVGQCGEAADKGSEFSFDRTALDGVNPLREVQPTIEASESLSLKGGDGRG